MEYSLKGASEYAGLFIGYPSSQYVKRHWEASQGHWNGHRVMAIVEAIPLLGGIIALIEKIAVSCFGSCFTLDPHNPSDVKILTSAAFQVRQRPVAFQSEIDQKDLENHQKLVARFSSNQDQDSRPFDHIVSFNSSFNSVAILRILAKKDSAPREFWNFLGGEDLDEIRHSRRQYYQDYFDDYLIYQTHQFLHAEDSLPSQAMMTLSNVDNMQRAYPSQDVPKKIPYYTNAVFINGIENVFMHELRAGSTLIQLAIEESISRGFEGRVFLKSVGNSGEFYSKLGFISMPLEKGENYMYLPKEAIVEWKARIAKHPIKMPLALSKTA